MRLLSGNPGMYQHSVEHTTEGETTQHEPEHGEDTIARVKGTEMREILIFSSRNPPQNKSQNEEEKLFKVNKCEICLSNLL